MVGIVEKALFNTAKTKNKTLRTSVRIGAHRSFKKYPFAIRKLGKPAIQEKSRTSGKIYAIKIVKHIPKTKLIMPNNKPCQGSVTKYANLKICFIN